MHSGPTVPDIDTQGDFLSPEIALNLHFVVSYVKDQREVP